MLYATDQLGNHARVAKLLSTDVVDGFLVIFNFPFGDVVQDFIGSEIAREDKDCSTATNIASLCLRGGSCDTAGIHRIHE